MAEQQKHIYRSSEGILGGVCAGVAERFDFDTSLLRILVVVLSVLSMGAFALFYLAVWLILPEKPKSPEALDVDPAAFHSEVYEQVVHGMPASSTQAAVPLSIPPVPPQAASAYYRAMPQMSYDAAYATAAPVASASAAGGAQQKTSSTRMVTTGLITGILLIMLGLVALASAFGIATIDMTAWIYSAGPFLFIMVGLYIMGRASKSNILILCAGIALVLFIVVGVYSSLRDGPVDLEMSLRFSPESVSEWQQD